MVFSSTFYHTLSLHKEPKKKKIHHSFSQISLLITHVNCQPLSHQVFLQTSLILTISFLFTNKKKKKTKKKKNKNLLSFRPFIKHVTFFSRLPSSSTKIADQESHTLPKALCLSGQWSFHTKIYLRCPLFHLLCLLSSLHALLFSLAAAHVIFPGSSVKPQNQ
jgi:hypothetical protein